jgi:two-component system, OmpR family, response regulator VanR
MINIMVVDDNNMVIELYKRIYKDYNVFEASNGIEGLQLYKDIKKKNYHIDLLISDVEMPYLDGIAMVSTLEKIYCLKDVKVVLTSGNSEYKEAAQLYGTFMEKPIGLKNLVSLIEDLEGGE